MKVRFLTTSTTYLFIELAHTTLNIYLFKCYIFKCYVLNDLLFLKTFHLQGTYAQQHKKITLSM